MAVDLSLTTLLKQSWDSLRQLQFNKKCSILRYEVTDEGKPHIGIGPTTSLVPNLADIDVYCVQVDIKEVLASHGRIEMSDLAFVFYTPVRTTDKILFHGVTYEVVQMRAYDSDIGIYAVIGRAVSGSTLV